MRGKNKSFVEDIIILFVLGLIIYAIYSFFFSSNENIIDEENKTTIEKNIEDKIQEESAILEAKINDEIKEDEVISETTNATINQSEKEDLSQVENILPKENAQATEEKKAIIEIKDINDKEKIELFYKSIREKISADIEKNINKNLLKEGSFVNIRLTVLKDGRYEQITLTEGNKEFFELIKPFIIKAFPVKIETSLKESFPRYFRMTIK